MVNKMASDLDRALKAMGYTGIKTAGAVNTHTDEAAERVIRATGYAGAQTTKAVNAHTDEAHDATRRLIRDTAEDTRDHVTEEADRTRRLIKRSRDILEWPDILIGLILAVITGAAAWYMESGVIVKPTAFDTSGNVLKYGPDTFALCVWAAAIAIVVFFVVALIVHAIRRR